MLGENEELRDAQLEYLRHKAAQEDGLHRLGGGDSLGPLAPLGEELIQELNERIEIMMSENALLVEQKSLLNQELDLHQNDLEQRTADLQGMAARLKALAEELQGAKAECLQAQQDREEAARQAVRFSEALGRAEGELDSVQDQLKGSQRKCKELEAALVEARRQSKDTRAAADDEGVKCMRHIKAVEDRIRELQLMLLQKTQEAEAAQEVLRKLRREYASTRQDAEGMLQVRY